MLHFVLMFFRRHESICSRFMFYTMMREERKTTLLFRNVYIFLFFRKGVKLLCCVWQTNGGRQDRLTYILLLTIAHCVIFKTHLALLLLGQGLSAGGRWEQQAPARRSNWFQTGFYSDLHCLQITQLEATQLVAAGRSHRLQLTLTLAFTVPNWLNYRGHLHILFHNAHLLPIRSPDILPLIYTGASLIDGSVKGQYVTLSYG